MIPTILGVASLRIFPVEQQERYSRHTVNFPCVSFFTRTTNEIRNTYKIVDGQRQRRRRQNSRRECARVLCVFGIKLRSKRIAFVVFVACTARVFFNVFTCELHELLMCSYVFHLACNILMIRKIFVALSQANFVNKKNTQQA